ncbi:PRTRC system protein E, partial [Phocaeicola vulgatus]
YAGQRPMSRQLPPQPAYAEQQISYRQEQEQNPEDLYPYYQRGQEVPTYRPEDYEEYPDFPQSMLEPNVSHYQSI